LKSIVFDSSSIISVSEKCFIKIFERMSQKAELAIPKKVEFEMIVKPYGIRQFELNSLRIKMALKNKWLKSIALKPEFFQLAQRIKNTANSSFIVRGRPFVLIQDGESETIALLRQLDARLLVIDERNTRMLIEDINGLKNYLESKIGPIQLDAKSINEFKKLTEGIKVCRSAEIIALAFEQGFLDEELEKSKDSLEAALWAVKYSGCAVSDQEIKDFLRIIS